MRDLLRLFQKISVLGIKEDEWGLEKIRQSIDKGLCTGAVYIDLHKAFDTVRHATLLEKLPSYGINDAELHWIGD